MSNIKKIFTVHDFNALLEVEDRHPYVSVIDFSAYPRVLFSVLCWECMAYTFARMNRKMWFTARVNTTSLGVL